MSLMVKKWRQWAHRFLVVIEDIGKYVAMTSTFEMLRGSEWLNCMWNCKFASLWKGADSQCGQECNSILVLLTLLSEINSWWFRWEVNDDDWVGADGVGDVVGHRWLFVLLSCCWDLLFCLNVDWHVLFFDRPRGESWLVAWPLYGWNCLDAIVIGGLDFLRQNCCRNYLHAEPTQ